MASSAYRPGTGLALIVSLLSLCTATSAVEFAGGTGTSNDPYQIATAEQLIALGSDPHLYDRCFALTADIDLDPCLPGGKAFDRAVIAPVNVYGPDSQTPAFTGTFDGQGHALRHLTIREAPGGYLGLMGLVGAGAHVRGVALEDVQIQGSAWTGSLAGKIEGGLVDNCRCSGRVFGDVSCVGGLVGESVGTAYVGCQASCSVAIYEWGGECFGGLIGRNVAGTVSRCSATGEMLIGSHLGVTHAGGLIGRNEDGVVRQCFSTGAIAMDGHDARFDGVGGLVGGLAGGAILDCYTTGAVTAGRSTGGLVGESVLGSIERSYAAGTLLLCEYCTAGGLVGHNDGTRVHGIWDTETSSLFTSEGGLGLGTAEMGDPAVYSLNGWGGDPNWVMEPGDYPHLAWEGKPGRPIPEAVIDWLPGQGTSDDPYRITQAAQLARLGLASVLWKGHFLLATDVDLKDVALRPLGAAQGMEFQGQFHGAGHVLANLSLDVARDVGLFGCVGANGQVADLGLRDVRLPAGMDANAVGPAAGLNQGTIARCFATGLIRVADRGICLGGLVGINEGLVEDCYAQVTFVPEGSWFWADHLGGLIGFNRAGQVSHCYATQLGRPFPDAGLVGGLVGSNTGKVLWSLWDVQTSGWSTSDGGLGFDTAEMKDAETYALNGWAQAPGWVMQSGSDYPRLVWEASAGATIPPAQIDEFSGQGTPDDPYRITQASQLARMGRAACLWDKCFALEADLDLSNEILRPIGVGGGMAFRGSFDGRGHVLRHPVLGSASERCLNEGLFGVVEQGGAIRNLAIASGRVTGGSYSSGLGLLAGCNGGDIDNCRVAGIVTTQGTSSNLGGMVGVNSGTVLNSATEATVAGAGAVVGVGGLAGANSGVIHACTADATVVADSGLESSDDGGSDVGGLVGQNLGGTLGDCQSRGTTAGQRNVGGLCGRNDGTVFHCQTLGWVTCGAGSSAVGGLVGRNSSGLVTMCWAAGSVTGGRGRYPDTPGVGGLVGGNHGIIESSSAAGDVVNISFSGAVGGLLGDDFGGMVIGCHSESAVLALGSSCAAGGLLGTHAGVLVDGYASGTLSGSPDPARTGGLVGYNAPAGWGQTGVIEAGFFLAPADGGGPDNGWGTPLSRQQMQSMESFVGWNFYGRAMDGDADVWFMPEGRAPVLAWQAPETGLAVVPNVVGLTPEQACAVLEPAGFRVGLVRTDFHRSMAAGRGIATEPLWSAPAGSVVDLVLSAGPYSFDENPGAGTAENPYQIATAGQLEALGDHPALWNRCFVLADDIDMSGRWFNRALIAPDEDEFEWGFQGTPFTGRFDGAGHVIYHLDVIASYTSCLGLFGRIGARAEVRDLRLEEVRVAGSQSIYVGAIAGHSQGSLVGCSARGLVCGGGSVGALVGLNDGTLAECSSEVLVQSPPSESDGRRR